MKNDARPDALVSWHGYQLEVWLVDGETWLVAGLWWMSGGTA